jgi:hypothetical protein
MDEEQYNRIMEQFFTRLERLTNQLGRGDTSAGSKTGTVPRQAKIDTSGKEAERLQQQANARAKLGIKANKEQLDAQDELTDSTDDLAKKTKNLGREWDSGTSALKRFGNGLLTGTSDLGGAISNLGSGLESSKNTVLKSFSKFAIGAGYVLGGMQEFAKNAAEMGTFADLNAFSAGSVTQMKIMSGLGNSFIKVIEGSQGGFKAFGKTSEEAVKNLSNLSRGLKYGAFHSNWFGMTLSSDVAKSMNIAAKAANGMGLADEDRAMLLGQLAQSSSLGAKDEQDAQERLVKQYADTLTNTRTLSNAFGTSAKEVLAAMAAFRKTQAGAVAGLEGNVGAANIAAVIKQLGYETDETKIANQALALSQGRMEAAQANLSNVNATPVLQMLNEQIQKGTGGGANMEKLTQNLVGQKDFMKQLYEERKSQQGLNDAYAAPAVAMGVLAKRIEQTGKIIDKETTAGSEAGNIKAMNTLTASLDFLRWGVVTLTATLVALTGILAPLVGGLALSKITSMFKGGGAAAGGITGALGGLFGKDGKGFAGGITGAIGGLFGKGGAVEAGGTVATTAASAGGAAAGAKNLGETMASMGSGAGKGISELLIGIGTGVGKGAEALLRGLAAGLQAFANPQVVAGAAGLAASIALIGAGAGVALWAVGKGLKVFGEGLAVVGAVDGGNLISIGAGLGAIGLGLASFSAGSLLATSTGVITGIASLFGVKSPFDRIKEFVPLADKISMVGLGIKNFGAGILDMNTGLNGFNKSALVDLQGQLAEFAIAGSSDAMRQTAEYLTQIGGALGNISKLGSTTLPNISNLTIPTVPTNMAANLPASNTLPTNILNNTALTPDVIAQVLVYLSSIETDLQAIRGNTRKSGYSPVTLA